MRRSDPRSGPAPAAGLYVHVPYCRRRCRFCAFKITTHFETVERFADHALAEADLRVAEFEGLAFDTVYFGGGTPSAVPPQTLVRILAGLRERFPTAGDAEVSVEANPGNYDRRSLAELRRSGFTRISIGVQSLSDDALRFLTRDHTAADGRTAVADARAAGFANVSVDLLYGLPGRTGHRLAADVDAIAALGADHVSAYQLTIEPGTPFSAMARRGDFRPFSEEEERQAFETVRDRLAAAGYAQYEVSSYARSPAFQSRHNRKYWEGAPYLGLGPSACSFRAPVRTENIAGVRQWAAAIAAGRAPAAVRETVTGEARRLERLFLGLRTTAGIDLAEFPGLLDAHHALVERLLADGAATRDGDRLRLTPAGLPLADGIAVELAG